MTWGWSLLYWIVIIVLLGGCVWISLYERFHRWVAGIGVVLFLSIWTLVAYFAITSQYHIEHPEPTPLIAKIPSVSPHFILTVLNGKHVVSENGEIGILLRVEIVNSGSPSIASGWQLEFITESGTHETYIASELYGDIRIITEMQNVASDVPVTVIKQSDSLLTIIKDKKIETGDSATGWLLFDTHFKKEDLEHTTTSIILSVEDIEGSRHSAPYHFSN